MRPRPPRRRRDREGGRGRGRGGVPAHRRLVLGMELGQSGPRLSEFLLQGQTARHTPHAPLRVIRAG
jgi:hypothetical protein